MNEAKQPVSEIKAQIADTMMQEVQLQDEIKRKQNRHIPSSKSTEIMPDEIFLPDDLDNHPVQQKRVNRQDGLLDQDPNPN